MMGTVVVAARGGNLTLGVFLEGIIDIDDVLVERR